jgi:DNA-binding GntR family transcriptional regulator
VADALRARITSGDLTGQLPSRMALADEFEVASKTVDAAVALLRDEGLVVSKPGLGTFVRKPAS